ncbi:MAG TPA: ketoacyl-ACP synthase III family protein [Pseudonocardiaceae bacterium]|nr:ketoacyl-ACP synthase III family protein [Pseudonocardiaceae bacterium]
MRWDGIHIGAAAAALGRPEATADAVAAGRYEADRNEAEGYLAVRVADQGPTVELAVDAANLALRRCGLPPELFGMVIHSCVSHQGLDHFAPASYVQRRTIGGSATALEVRQASGGGLASIEMAAAYLTAKPEPPAVLVTTADRFVPPAYDRYHTDGGLLFSDGATAMVLSRQPGVARLLSSSLIGDTTHGGLYDGNAPWTEAPGAGGWPVELGPRSSAHVERLGGPEAFIDIVRSLDYAQQETVRVAVEDAGLAVADIDWWVFPNVGQTLVDWETYKAMGIDQSRTIWDEWGRYIGHLGAGDQLAGLAYLFETKRVRIGDRVLLNGAGQGFTFASIVLEITGVPDWSRSSY